MSEQHLEIKIEIRTLVLSVAALNLFVQLFLNLALQDSRSGRLIKPSCFKYVCRIDPIIVPPAHNMLFQVGTELELIHRNLGRLAVFIGKLSKCQCRGAKYK